MTDEAMGFREAVGYGMRTYLEHLVERHDYAAQASMTGHDIAAHPYLPHLPNITITPSLAAATRITQLELVRENGTSLTPEQTLELQAGEDASAEHARFDRSIWSRFFPMLTARDDQIVILEHSVTPALF
jgi:hypothetical protein